jgi:hypothetical protein
MAMRFRYGLETAPRPVHSLGGRWVRPRPVILVSVVGPAGTLPRPALLDTGSDDTVFPDHFAALLGVDLANAPTGEAAGVGGQSVQLRYADVTLRLTDGKERREWPATVGFTAVRLRRPLLGFAGFLRFFTATFQGDREEIELAVNSLYPGT